MQDGRLSIIRIQKNVVARRERQLLNWFCANLPGWIMPDHLTVLGIFGAFLIFGGYFGSRFSPEYLWLSSAGLFLHWFGDSLDGSLARHRRIERPVYGYFLDHTVDAMCNLLIMIGLGLTIHVRMDVALFALIGYYLLCIYVFINNHLSGVFQLSFFGCGPTELRIFLLGLNIGMYSAGRAGGTLGGQYVTVYDALVLLTGVVFTSVFVVRMCIGILQLRNPERRPVQLKPVVVPPPSVTFVSERFEESVKRPEISSPAFH